MISYLILLSVWSLSVWFQVDHITLLSIFQRLPYLLIYFFFIRFLVEILSFFAKIENWLRHPSPYPGEVGMFAALRDTIIAMKSGSMGLFRRLETFYPNVRMPIYFYMGGMKCLYLKEATQIVAVHRSVKNTSFYGFPVMMDRLRDLLGLNLVTTSNYSQWHEMRIRSVAYLNGEYLHRYEENMKLTLQSDIIPSFNRCARFYQPVDIWRSMLIYGSKVVFLSFVGASSSEFSMEIHELLSEMFDLLRTILPSVVALPRKKFSWIPTNVKFNSNMKRAQQYVRPYLEKFRESDTMLGSIVRTYTLRKTLLPEELVEFLRGVLNNPHYELPEAAVEVLRENNFTNTSLYESVRKLVLSLNLDVKGLQVKLENFICYGRSSHYSSIDEELILQEIVGNLIGGSETTIAFMTFCCYYMAKYPSVQEKLRAYLQENKEVPIMEKISKGYLGQVLNETLRLQPPGFAFFRTLLEPVRDEDGVELPANTPMWFSQYYVHRDPIYWGSDSEEFRPERWSKPIIPGSFLPFGLGDRTCAGNNYAKREAGFMLATLLDQFKIELEDPNYKLELDMNTTLRPVKPIMCNVTRI